LGRLRRQRERERRADVLGYVDLEKIGIVEVGARAGLRFGVNRA